MIKILPLLLLINMRSIIGVNSDGWINDPNIQLPPSIKICSRNLPSKARNACFKETVYTAISEFKNGYPPLGISPFEPFKMGKFRIKYATGPLEVISILKNGICHGPSNFKINSLKSKISDESLNVELDILFPILNPEGNYKGLSTFNSLKVRSEGYLNITAYNVSCKLKVIGETKASDPKYMKIISFDMTNVRIQNLNLQASGIVSDPEINQLAIEFINQNWRYVYRDVIATTKEHWEPLFLSLANKVFERVPFERIISND